MLTKHPIKLCANKRFANTRSSNGRCYAYLNAALAISLSLLVNVAQANPYAPTPPQWRVGDDFTAVVTESNEKTNGSHSWSNKLEPPVLSSPKVYKTVESLPLLNVPATSVLWCDGKEYVINAGNDTDVYIDLTGQGVLQYPLLIRSARKVIIRGLTMRLMVQPGCGPYQLTNYKPGGGLLHNANLQPRTPGGAGINTNTSDDVWIEGVDVDVTGHNIDAIIHRHHKNGYNATAIGFKDVSVVNSRIVGWDGGSSESAPVGDQPHADLWHSQGSYGPGGCIAIDVLRSLNFENVVAEHSQQGISMVPDNCDNLWTQSAFLRNYSRMPDKRYDDDDVMDYQWGLDTVYVARGKPVHIENFWYHYGPKTNWKVGMALKGEGFAHEPNNSVGYYVDCAILKGIIPCHPEFHYAETVPVDFAPKAHVGANYVTPWRKY